MPAGATEKCPRLPPEILDRIFGHLERKLRVGYAYSDFTPQWFLHPLLFVCKEWHETAMKRLYSSVSVGGVRPSDHEGEREILEGFSLTVAKNPRIASLVRELRVYSEHQLEEDTLVHLDLLRICKNVVRVEIAGYPRILAEELRNTLGEMDLVELDISRAGRGVQGCGSFGDDFCKPSELIACMLKWPRLRRIHTRSIFKRHEEDDPSILPCPSTVRGRCPMLEEITFWYDYVHADNLAILCEMAPNLQKLDVRPHSCTEDPDVLSPCLRSWSSTLSSLDLGHYGTPSITSIFPELSRLCSFHVHSKVVPPDALLGLTQLKVLTYTPETRGLERLAFILREAHSFPTLRKLQILPNNDEWVKETLKDQLGRCIAPLKSTRVTCKEKGIEVSDFLDQIAPDEDEV